MRDGEPVALETVAKDGAAVFHVDGAHDAQRLAVRLDLPEHLPAPTAKPCGCADRSPRTA